MTQDAGRWRVDERDCEVLCQQIRNIMDGYVEFRDEKVLSTDKIVVLKLVGIPGHERKEDK
jgi:hypothetical protein